MRPGTVWLLWFLTARPTEGRDHYTARVVIARRGGHNTVQIRPELDINRVQGHDHDARTGAARAQGWDQVEAPDDALRPDAAGERR